MRVTDITLNTNDEEIAVLSFRSPRTKNRYIAKAITGLDSDELVSKFYAFGLTDAERFFSVGLKQRVIVMRITLNPKRAISETPSDLRDEIYRMISANRTGIVDIHFYAGATLLAYLSGKVTKIEVPHFSRESEVQVTFECQDPILRAVNPVILETENISTVNPVVVADSLSTSPHGFKFQVTFHGNTEGFTIQDKATPDWKFEIYPASLGTSGGSAGFHNNDVLHFSSEPNEKTLYVVRSGITYPLMDKIRPNSVWPVIFPGQNKFHILSDTTFTWNTIEYYAAYWGV